MRVPNPRSRSCLAYALLAAAASPLLLLLRPSARTFVRPPAASSAASLASSVGAPAAGLRPGHPSSAAAKAPRRQAELHAERQADGCLELATRQVLLVSSPESEARFQRAAEAALGAVRKGQEVLVGLDAEWGPSSPLSLLQLAISVDGESAMVYLLDLMTPLSGITLWLFRLLLSRAPGDHHRVYTFCHDEDLQRLRTAGLAPLEPCEWTDLSLVDWGLGPTPGLAQIARHALGYALDKSLQTSDWVSRPLTSEQVLYAARDAFVLLRLSSVAPSLTSSADADGVLDVQNLQPGHELNGTVLSATQYSVLVDVGADRPGIVSRKRLGAGYVENVADVVQAEEQVRVRVTNVTRSGLLLAMDATAHDFADVPPTQWLRGVVVGFAEYGVFVSVWPADGGRSKEGLVLSFNMNCTKEDLAPGQEVRVRVIQAGVENDNLELAMKEISDRRAADLVVGQELTGMVVSLTPYGFFVDIGVERPGLVHLSRAGAGYVERVEDIVRMGEQVQVRVIDVTPAGIALAMDATAEDFEDLPVTQWLKAVVVNPRFHRNVAAVAVWSPGEGRSKECLVNHSSPKLSRGQEVKVRVIEADIESDALQLAMSVKPLKTTRGKEHAAMGQELNGSVTALAPYGFYVDVGIGRPGLMHLSRMGAGWVKKPGDVAQVGDRLQVRVVNCTGSGMQLAMDATASDFANVSKTQWLKGEVVILRENSAIVAVWPPGGDRSKDGPVRYFGDYTKDTLSQGQEVKVRVVGLNLTEDYLKLSLAPTKSQAASAEEALPTAEDAPPPPSADDDDGGGGGGGGGGGAAEAAVAKARTWV